MKTKNKYKYFLCLKCKNFCLTDSGFDCKKNNKFDNKKLEKFDSCKIRKCNFFYL